METQESKDEMLSVKVASNKRANVKIKKTPKVQIFTTSDHEEDVVKSSNNSVSIFDTPLIKSPKILKKASKKLKKPLSEKNNAKKTSKKATEVKADPSLNKNSPSKEIIEKENITSPVLAVNDNENKTETKKDTQEKKKKTIATVKTRASKIGNRSSFPEAVKKAEKAKSTRHSTACELKNQPQNKRNSVVFNVFTPKLNDESKPPRTPSPNPLQKKVQMERDVALLESIFPNIDPAFLKIQYLKMKRSVEDTVDLIAVRKTKGEAPTKKAQFNKSAIESFLKKYTTEFSVESFLKAIPDPWNYFLNSELHNSIRYAELSLEYLKNKHTKHYVQTIENTLVSCEYSLYRSNKELSNKRKNLMFKMRRTNRKNDYGSGEFPIVDFQFVQEVNY